MGSGNAMVLPANGPGAYTPGLTTALAGYAFGSLAYVSSAKPLKSLFW